jgi:ZIP family zinc transporter
MNGSEAFFAAFLASLLAGLGTGLGAVPIFAFRRLAYSLETTLLSLCAGVMLAAASLSLLLPALDMAAAGGAPAWRGGAVVGLGVLLGGLGFWLAHRLVPHEHFIKGREGGDARLARRLWLFVLAITLHNFPEGLAVGAGFNQPDAGRGVALALGIAIQNMPEGFIVALALRALGHSTSAAFAVALLTGLVEPVGGAVGAAAVSFVAPLVPWTLAAAAGAMIFVVGGEMIPETHGRGYDTQATFGLVGGFALMTVLSVSL